MGRRSAPLSPVETAALTRLAISFCLGRGSLCIVTRSISLQLYHPQRYGDLAFYQWRRICAFLPTCKQPFLHDQATAKRIPTDGADPSAGNPDGTPAQWRLRLSSLHFQVAYRLLYPGGKIMSLQLTPETLSLVGAEGIASLWADRARLIKGRGQPLVQGRLNLSRYSFTSAHTVAQWIAAITTASSIVGKNPASDGPMLFFDHEQTIRLLGALEGTWHAQAACLREKFTAPQVSDLQEQLIRERLALVSGTAPRWQEELPMSDEQRGEVQLRVKKRRAPAALPQEALPNTLREPSKPSDAEPESVAAVSAAAE
ncbi:MAG: hypothetical protein WBM08_04910 [Prochlorococcaceae cyanobacterium]